MVDLLTVYMYPSFVFWHCGKPAIWSHLQVLHFCSWSVWILMFRIEATSGFYSSSAGGIGSVRFRVQMMYLLSKTISELICAMLFLAMSPSVFCQPLISVTNMHLQLL